MAVNRPNSIGHGEFNCADWWLNSQCQIKKLPPFIITLPPSSFSSSPARRPPSPGAPPPVPSMEGGRPRRGGPPLWKVQSRSPYPLSMPGLDNSRASVDVGFWVLEEMINEIFTWPCSSSPVPVSCETSSEAEVRDQTIGGRRYPEHRIAEAWLDAAQLRRQHCALGGEKRHSHCVGDGRCRIGYDVVWEEILCVIISLDAGSPVVTLNMTIREREVGRILREWSRNEIILDSAPRRAETSNSTRISGTWERQWRG